MLLLAHPAAAQMGPGGFGAPGGGGMQPPPAQGGEKEEGPAEEAPEENRPADLEPLSGYADQTKRKMQIFELNGYLRLRDDYMHDFFLGLGYSNGPERLDGPRYDELRPATVSGAARLPVARQFARSPDREDIAGSAGQNCPTSNMGGANLRFRLEPTLNVTDQVRVHAQIDVLDNTILGSTPDSLAGIQGFNTPPSTTNTSADLPAGRRPVWVPVADAGPARNRAERLHLQRPGQARLGGDRHRVRLDLVRPDALELGTRDLLQRRKLRRLRRRHDGRSGHGQHDHLRAPAEVRLGSGRAGGHHPAALAWDGSIRAATPTTCHRTTTSSS